MKKAVFILSLVILVISAIAIYWNHCLYQRAENSVDVEEKIKILEKANHYYPFNDLVYYELGIAFYDLGIRNLDEIGLSTSLFQKSISNFHKSLLLNPASQYCHFSLARSLFYLNVLLPSSNLTPEDELKKAAFLVDHNSEIFMEVGKLFLGRWNQLSEEDRIFASGILRKIMESKNRQKLQNLFHVWEINIKDYKVMDQIMPKDPFIFRRMAEYLGERGLFLENRQRLLAEAEYLESEEAKSTYRAGETEFYRFNLMEASKHFRSCLNALNNIRFFQVLTQQNLIDNTEYIQIKKSSYLYLAKCMIEEKSGLPLEAKKYLELYLSLEQDVGAISELEKYLIERRILDKKLDDNFDKMDKLALYLILTLKQKKNADIIRIGRIIHASSIVITDEMKDDYIKILLILGEAFYKADYIYDADDYYQRAYELNPQNLNTHLKMVQNYERLGNHQEIQRISERLERILYPKNSRFAIQIIKKGSHSSRKMVLDGREIILDLHFMKNLDEIQPIVAVNFNGYVVWEDFLRENVLSLTLESQVGENNLQIVAVNKDIYIDKMIYRFIE